MSFLLDTNLLSELRKGDRADAGVRAWFDLAWEEELFLSVLVLGEVRHGIERKRRTDAAAARNLGRWLDSLIEEHGDRLLPVDQAVADQWGHLNAQHTLPVVDGLIAATALVHDLVLVTRNERDFQRTGARVLNPFARPGK